MKANTPLKVGMAKRWCSYINVKNFAGVHFALHQSCNQHWYIHALLITIIDVSLGVHEMCEYFWNVSVACTCYFGVRVEHDWCESLDSLYTAEAYQSGIKGFTDHLKEAEHPRGRVQFGKGSW
jgi:hypothetical protein